MFNFTLFPSPVPWYSFDWLAMWQKKELLGGTLLRLAFVRSSVTVDGWLGGRVWMKEWFRMSINQGRVWDRDFHCLFVFKL